MRFPTILSGDLNGNDGTGLYDADRENSRHVVLAWNVDETAILDGFQVVSGNADYGSVSNQRAGGGLLVLGCSPTIRNCFFAGNQAEYGAGICSIAGAPHILGCTFVENKADKDGGGVFNFVGTVLLEDCGFSGNIAGWGGAVSCAQGGTATLRGCVLQDNRAYTGGGVWVREGDLTLDSCLFTGNVGAWGLDDDSTGGVLASGAFVSASDSVFRENRGSRGGGVGFDEESDGEFVGCDFIGNQASAGGALAVGLYCSLALESCRLIGNSAGSGGGISSWYSWIWACDTLFAGNSASYGGAARFYHDISFVDYPVEFANCTFAENESNDQGALYFGFSPSIPYFGTVDLTNCILRNGGNEISIELESPITLSYCNIEGGWDGAGEGNFDADPLFVDPDGADGVPGTDDDDLHLLPASPCIDQGDPTLDLEPGVTDLDGRPRVLCGRVDVGVYEFGAGDYNCDRDIDLTDFDAWQACMSGPDSFYYFPGCEAFDFEFDGDVDLADLAAFISTFDSL